MDRHLWQFMWVRDVFWISFFFFVIWFGYALRGLVTPVLIGLLLGYLCHPVVLMVERKWEVHRNLIVGALLAVIMVVGGLIGWWASGELIALALKAPEYLDKLATDYGWEAGALRDQVAKARESVENDPYGAVASVYRQVFAGTGAVVGLIGEIINNVTYMAISAMLIAVYFFSFACNLDSYYDGFKSYLPSSARDRTVDILAKMNIVFSSFFRDRLVICLLMSAVLCIGWWIAGVPYWFVLGLATGLLNMMPYVSALGCPAAILLKYVELSTTAEPAAGDVTLLSIVIAPLIVYVIAQALEGWVLTPLIQGKSSGLGAVTILFVVLAGGTIGGLYGLLLAIPVTSCLKILTMEIFLPRLQTWADSR